MTIPKKKSS